MCLSLKKNTGKITQETSKMEERGKCESEWGLGGNNHLQGVSFCTVLIFEPYKYPKIIQHFKNTEN